MPDNISRLLKNNKLWVESQLIKDKDFYTNLSNAHQPEYLWIGCSDARVPANEITGTLAGEIFVHRNIANMVIHTDMNMLSVLSYAVEVLKVKHIIVCGHYGCGGINAALSNKKFGLIDNWLRHIKDVYKINLDELENIKNPVQRANRLVELNVIQQVHDLCTTSIVQDAWKKSEFPYIHGWVYDVHDGLLRDLKVTLNNNSSLKGVYKFEG
ncbi:MAG: carbonate dehydratase [Bacteroidia bacterium]